MHNRVSPGAADMKEVAEGVPTILAARRLASKLGLNLPLLNAIHSMVYNGASVADILPQLLDGTVVEEN